MIDKVQALEIIDKRDLFNDRAGRELWNDKPKEIQDEDIRNAHEDYEALKEYILNQPEVGEWIPCSERLPEDLMTVNVTWVNRKPQTYYSYIKDKPFTNTALRFNGKWYWWSVVTEDILREYGESVMDEIDNGIEVIAWQPLPEPYSSGD